MYLINEFYANLIQKNLPASLDVSSGVLTITVDGKEKQLFLVQSEHSCPLYTLINNSYTSIGTSLSTLTDHDPSFYITHLLAPAPLPLDALLLELSFYSFFDLQLIHSILPSITKIQSNKLYTLKYPSYLLLRPKIWKFSLLSLPIVLNNAKIAFNALSLQKGCHERRFIDEFDDFVAALKIPKPISDSKLKSDASVKSDSSNPDKRQSEKFSSRSNDKGAIYKRDSEKIDAKGSGKQESRDYTFEKSSDKRDSDRFDRNDGRDLESRANDRRDSDSRGNDRRDSDPRASDRRDFDKFDHKRDFDPKESDRRESEKFDHRRESDRFDRRDSDLKPSERRDSEKHALSKRDSETSRRDERRSDERRSFERREAEDRYRRDDRNDKREYDRRDRRDDWDDRKGDRKSFVKDPRNDLKGRVESDRGFEKPRNPDLKRVYDDMYSPDVKKGRALSAQSSFMSVESFGTGASESVKAEDAKQKRLEEMTRIIQGVIAGLSRNLSGVIDEEEMKKDLIGAKVFEGIEFSNQKTLLEACLDFAEEFKKLNL